MSSVAIQALVTKFDNENYIQSPLPEDKYNLVVCGVSPDGHHWCTSCTKISDCAIPNQVKCNIPSLKKYKLDKVDICDDLDDDDDALFISKLTLPAVITYDNGNYSIMVGSSTILDAFPSNLN